MYWLDMYVFIFKVYIIFILGFVQSASRPIYTTMYVLYEMELEACMRLHTEINRCHSFFICESSSVTFHVLT